MPEKKKDIGTATSTRGKKLLVAAVQMESVNDSIHTNLSRAAHFVEDAASLGARLILLPEFFSTGYSYTPDIWYSAETIDGPTVRWLKQRSSDLSVWIGGCFLEADGRHFYNTFVLTDPDGNVAGTVRKQTPASFENHFFRGVRNDHVIETDLGIVGVGICYENQRSFTLKDLFSQKADIVLMPHSAPISSVGLFTPHGTVNRSIDDMKRLPAHYARALGVPVVYCNKRGIFSSRLPWTFGMRETSRFPGLSAIADSDGVVIEQMADGEGIIIGEVILDPSLKSKTPPKTGRIWIFRPYLLLFLIELTGCLGRIRYALSVRRKRLARRVSGLNKKG
ncbi:MAG: carbon-nitrogen hydrolase family protein [Deltaproteobacteria bacterium]|nr:carbon-nitrogen hydrolase family protein [Candidatus Zymogenaceae bacterium]